jgi:uncharacterized protein (TIGR03067 family)
MLAIAAPDRPAPGPAKEFNSFKEATQGQWLITSALSNGGDHPMMKQAPVTFLFERDLMTIRKVNYKDNIYTLTFDTTKNPIEVEISSRNINGKETKGQPIHGIIKIEGDVLTICFQTGGKAGRPSEFACKKGEQTMLWQMKRIK